MTAICPGSVNRNKAFALLLVVASCCAAGRRSMPTSQWQLNGLLCKGVLRPAAPSKSGVPQSEALHSYRLPEPADSVCSSAATCEQLRRDPAAQGHVQFKSLEGVGVCSAALCPDEACASTHKYAHLYVMCGDLAGLHWLCRVLPLHWLLFRYRWWTCTRVIGAVCAKRGRCGS